MPATLIATTRAADVQALGTAGQRTTDSWSALHRVLRDRLSPAHAALLAEPVVNAAQGETDWYAEVEGDVSPLLSLPADRQGAVRARLEQLSGEIMALAGALEAERSEGDRFVGAMLRLAMRVPGEEQVFVAGEEPEPQPMLAAWGHARAGAGGGSVVLGGDRAAARNSAGRRAMAILPPPPAPVPAVRRWGPVLAASLAVALLCLAASGYAVARDPFGWYAVAEPACQPPGDDMALRTDLQNAADRESELRLQLAQLSTDAGGRRLMCPPVQPPPQVTALAPPPPAPRSADQSRAQDRGAKRGKLTLILAWDDRNDLDLQVRCPGGGTIFFAQRSACGGTLDVDANGDARVADAQPVENVFFPEPRPGTYQVIVDPYAMRIGRTTPFRLTVQQDGKPDRVVTGMAEAGRRVQEVATVTVEGGS